MASLSRSRVSRCRSLPPTSTPITAHCFACAARQLMLNLHLMCAGGSTPSSVFHSLRKISPSTFLISSDAEPLLLVKILQQRVLTSTLLPSSCVATPMTLVVERRAHADVPERVRRVAGQRPYLDAVFLADALGDGVLQADTPAHALVGFEFGSGWALLHHAEFLYAVAYGDRPNSAGDLCWTYARDGASATRRASLGMKNVMGISA